MRSLLFSKFFPVQTAIPVDLAPLIAYVTIGSVSIRGGIVALGSTSAKPVEIDKAPANPPHKSGNSIIAATATHTFALDLTKAVHFDGTRAKALDMLLILRIQLYKQQHAPNVSHTRTIRSRIPRRESAIFARHLRSSKALQKIVGNASCSCC